MLRYCAHSEENFHAAFGDKKKMNQKKRFLGELILFQSTEREYFFYEKKKYFDFIDSYAADSPSSLSPFHFIRAWWKIDIIEGFIYWWRCCRRRHCRRCRRRLRVGSEAQVLLNCCDGRGSRHGMKEKSANTKMEIRMTRNSAEEGEGDEEEN